MQIHTSPIAKLFLNSYEGKGKIKVDQNRDGFGTGIEAVITSFNQGTMILEAVESLCTQTVLPQKIIIVDDGSTDGCSIRILKDMEKKAD